ncbi:MAG: histidine phosphatase family protein [bacterium]
MTSTTHDPNSTHALLTIVRHGQTSANVDGVWHGSTNTALTDHGRRQAAAVGAHIEANYQPIAHVYASPLDRAHQTAQAIATPLGLTPILDDELVEFDLGDWEGMAFKELTEDKRLFQNMSADPHFAPHGGESPKQVGDRLAGALTRLALGLLLDDHYAEWNRMMKNCAISELAFAPKAELLSFNQREHLPSENTA